MFQAAVAEAAARCAAAGGLAPETPWRELLEDPQQKRGEHAEKTIFDPQKVTLGNE